MVGFPSLRKRNRQIIPRIKVQHGQLISCQQMLNMKSIVVFLLSIHLWIPNRESSQKTLKLYLINTEI